MLYQLSYTPSIERKKPRPDFTAVLRSDGFYTLFAGLQTAFCKKMRRAEARRTSGL